MRGRITGQENLPLPGSVTLASDGVEAEGKAKGRRGFSLLETTIAMALIAIVFAMAITTVQAASTTRRRSQNRRFFVTEISNYLECYRMGGSTGFQDNVQTYLGVSLGEASEGVYTVYYGADYRVVDSAGSAAFAVTLKLGPSTQAVYAGATAFSAVAADSSGNEIYRSKFDFVSRYDLVEGGGA